MSTSMNSHFTGKSILIRIVAGRLQAGSLPGRLVVAIVAIFLFSLHGTAFGQLTNEITDINPDIASPGATDLLVTFTLDIDSPPPPPAGDGPQSVMIGDISGTSITHTSPSIVTAVFTIPDTEPAGACDVTIEFAVPGGTLEFIMTDGFTVGSQDGYTIERTLSNEAQRKTIAFDGLAFLTGNLGAQSFLPPGKVADYFGFQYLRDNDPTGMGHNTDFVTIIAFNVLNLMTTSQLDQLVAAALIQVDQINEYAYERFPLIDAFRRLQEGDQPPGSSGLDLSAVQACSADLYRIDGQVSYNRAKLLGSIIRLMAPDQVAALDSLIALGGIGHWDDTLTDPLQNYHLEPDVHVAVMTYASEMYGWYAGSAEADVYFCPERQGTYFGSFYLKDWPCMGNPDCDIDEQLTARAGEEFLSILTDTQSAIVTDLVDLQRDSLYEIVDRRYDIAVELRRFMTEESIDSVAVLDLSARYGELDGEIVYYYATHFSEVGQLLNSHQQETVTALADSLGYEAPTGAFLYAEPIPMPDIGDTDFLFEPLSAGVEDDDTWGTDNITSPPAVLTLSAGPNPARRNINVAFGLPTAVSARVTIYDVCGRMINLLADDDFTAGEHNVAWLGTDMQDVLVPAGIYFVRLTTPGRALNRKFIVTR